MFETQPIFEPLRQVTARPFHLVGENVDTDQILPAQFLSWTSRNGLGPMAFFDWRQGPHPLNDLMMEERRIFIVGRNFGCGSSREHAPWALYEYGVRVILGNRMADIFRSNCLKNGIVALNLEKEVIAALLAHPDRITTVDLERGEILQDGRVLAAFELDALSRHCLLTGSDQLGILLEGRDAVLAFEARQSRPVIDTRPVSAQRP